MKKFEVQCKWETFTQFCDRIAAELGETLYKVCDPTLSAGKITVIVPENNINRIAGAVTNFSGTTISVNAIQ